MAKNKDMSLTASPDWHAWLGRVSRLNRTSRAAVIDRSLAELARREGWPEPPARLADKQAEPTPQD